MKAGKTDKETAGGTVAAEKEQTGEGDTKKAEETAKIQKYYNIFVEALNAGKKYNELLEIQPSEAGIVPGDFGYDEGDEKYMQKDFLTIAISRVYQIHVLTKQQGCSPSLRWIAKDLEAPYSFILQILKHELKSAAKENNAAVGNNKE